MMPAWLFDLMTWGWLLLGALTAGYVLMPDRYGRAKDYAAIAGVYLLLGEFLWIAWGAWAQDGADRAAFVQAAHVSAQAADAVLASVFVPVSVAAYLAVGVLWAMLHFWLYARRLERVYVLERELWLREHHAATVDTLSVTQWEAGFEAVIRKVKAAMLYRGDFPLLPLQQKRFLLTNVLGWPLTLAVYLVGDLMRDVAQSIWFALRDWVHRRWAAGMAQYRIDDTLCHEYLAHVDTDPNA